VSAQNRSFELWADSFHEGDWACRNLGSHLETKGYKATVKFKQGFIPEYSFSKDGSAITLTVFGSYKSWSLLPAVIKDALEWGKPDFMLYDPVAKKILFAVEETAAVPTGNQALQRCERMYGALRVKIPFWYLISEFGQHVDGGVRRDSIWPTIMALKLTRHFQTPCVVLHYSDVDNPEDYGSGSGLAALFSCMAEMLCNCHTGEALLTGLEKHLLSHYQAMFAFIKAQWPNLVDFLPGEELLESSAVAKGMAECAAGGKQKKDSAFSNFLVWPKFSDLPKKAARSQHSKGLIKHDALCELFEKDLDAHKAYSLSNNTGSRPQPRESVAKWITQQIKLFGRGLVLEPSAEYNVKLSDFPESESGLLHVTTAKNIVYLYDHWRDVEAAIVKAYPRLKGRIHGLDADFGTLVYVSNSIKPGRIFGDPYTGQIAAYSTVFGKIDPQPRYVLAYFPHQAYSQAIVGEGDQSNKGLTLMSELTDVLLFAGGVAVKLSSREVL